MCSFKEVFVMLPWYHIINITLLLIVYTYLGYMFYTTERQAVMKIKNTAYGFRKWAKRLFIIRPGVNRIRRHLNAFYDFQRFFKNVQFPWIEVFMKKIFYMNHQWLQFGTIRRDEKRLDKDAKVAKKVRFSSQLIVSKYICDQDNIQQTGNPDSDNVNMKMGSVFVSDDNLTLSECLGYARCGEMVEEKDVDDAVNGNGFELGNFHIGLSTERINHDNFGLSTEHINHDNFDACSDVGIKDLFEETNDLELENELTVNNVGEKIKLRKPFRKRFISWIAKCFLCGRSNSD